MSAATRTPPGNAPASAPSLTVMAPCYNEADNIDSLVDRTLGALDGAGIDGELLLVDDGSRDDTWARIQQRSRLDARVRGLRHSLNGGIEAAWRTGMQSAAAELVCLIDADLQNRPEDIPTLFRAYQGENADVVQGVRHPQAGVRRCRMFSRGLNLLLNLVFRMRLRDNKSGFILCRREVLRSLLTHRYRYRYFQSFIGVAAGARGYRIAQVDTPFEQRHAGQSFLPRFPIRVSLRILWELFKFRVETVGERALAGAGEPLGWPAAGSLVEPAGAGAER